MNYEKEISELFKASHLMTDEFVFTAPNKLSYTISWGDWKHEHLYSKWLIEDWAKKNRVIAVELRSYETETDGSDCYSGVHEWVFIKMNKK